MNGFSYCFLEYCAFADLDDSIFLTMLFSVLFWLLTAFTCLLCVSECLLLKGLVKCTLQIWALIYLVLCLRNNTGPS